MKRSLVSKITRTTGRKSVLARYFSTEIIDTTKESDVREISKSYEPQKVEPLITQKWKTRKIKQTDDKITSKGIFRMILPPPNVTGKLHIGHALTVAIEDTFARWSAMNGFKVEWIPGFDHAGIATQSVVMRKLKNDVILGTRPIEASTLQNELQSFASYNSTNIAQQLEAMGGLLDWKSSYYTLDKNHSEVVKAAFIKLFHSGIIRRGDGIVNWSCILGSSVSDIEVNQADFKGKTSFRIPGCENLIDFGVLYFIEYRIEGSDEKIMVATSRPETMFGDVALAVHPDDPRHTSLIGKQAKNPINGCLLPILADKRVKAEFGSGVLKVTPAHDKTDFLIGTSHGLKPTNVLSEKGILNNNCGEFEGLDRFTARQKVIEFLLQKNVIAEIKDYSGSIGLCSRTGDVIEPRILPHWFFRTKDLTQKFLKLVENNELIILPANQLESLKAQLFNVEDWCLSRQICWGHQIPAFYHVNSPEKWAAASNVDEAKNILKAKGIEIKDLSEIIQDKDVLDTWFSSALIPLAISGWPKSEDIKDISLMETGWDILLFWVWRMVIMNLALTEKLPFRKVLLHGIVTDHYGRKMAKSKGNVVDPMDIINGISFPELKSNALKSFETGELEQNEYTLKMASLEKDYPKGFPNCGSDALRFTLLSQDICNQEIKMSSEHLISNKHFTNKLWQAMRFYLRYAEEGINHPTEIAKPAPEILKSLADHWILSCLHSYAINSFKNMKLGHLHLYAEATRKFFYQQMCDVYIELIKSDMRSGVNLEQHVLVMRYVLGSGLKLAHPLMPFVTEEIWSNVSKEKNGLLIDQIIPTTMELEVFWKPELENYMTKVMKIVKEIRSVKSKVQAKETLTFYIEIPTSKGNKEHPYERFISAIETLAGGKVLLQAPPKLLKHRFVMYTFALDDKTCRVSTVKNADLMKTIQANDVKAAKLKLKLDKLKAQMENPSFQQNAPPEAKEKLRKKVEILQMQLDETGNHSSKFS